MSCTHDGNYVHMCILIVMRILMERDWREYRTIIQNTPLVSSFTVHSAVVESTSDSGGATIILIS